MLQIVLGHYATCDFSTIKLVISYNIMNDNSKYSLAM